jgi:uncharacterized coiled-coil protein SlyX
MESPLANLDSRLLDAEMKIAFLERELDEYKDVVNEMHTLLTRLEKQVQELKDGKDSTRNVEDYWKPEEP